MTGKQNLSRFLQQQIHTSVTNHRATNNISDSKLVQWAIRFKNFTTLSHHTSLAILRSIFSLHFADVSSLREKLSVWDYVRRP